jgi:hypothetical protein
VEREPFAILDKLGRKKFLMRYWLKFLISLFLPWLAS